MNKFKKILILAPHTDDGELGAGASINKFIEQGAEVTYVAFSIAEQSVPEGMPKDILKTEVKLATKQLGIEPQNLIIFNYPVRNLNFARQDILEDMIKIRRSKEFDLVLMPSLKDIHQDHATVAQEALRAFKNISILGYEVLWNNLSFDTTCFIKLEEKHLEKKISALNCYSSQAGRIYMSKEFIFSLAKVRGVQIGSDYAECFEVVRWVLN